MLHKIDTYRCIGPFIRLIRIGHCSGLMCFVQMSMPAENIALRLFIKSKTIVVILISYSHLKEKETPRIHMYAFRFNCTTVVYISETVSRINLFFL